MAKPKIYCTKTKRDPEGYLRCQVNSEYCGLVKYCRAYGWWEQIPAASLCAIHKKEENDGKTLHPHA